MPHLIVTLWAATSQRSNRLLFLKAQEHFHEGFWGGILFLQEWACLLSFFLFSFLSFNGP